MPAPSGKLVNPAARPATQPLAPSVAVVLRERVVLRGTEATIPGMAVVFRGRGTRAKEKARSLELRAPSGYAKSMKEINSM